MNELFLFAFLLVVGSGNNTGRRGTNNNKSHFGCSSAEVLCKTNIRFLLGLLAWLGYGLETVSLHMFAVEHIIRELDRVLDMRKVQGGRKYQLYQEIRMVLWWMADTLRDENGTAAAFLDNPDTVFPSYLLVEVTYFGTGPVVT
jgi:hypothetical protein